MLGDTTSFFIGERLGRGFLERHGPRVKITHERLNQVEGYFDRHGGKTILIGRFIGLVRALAPFIAGASGLAYRRFLPYSVVGTGLWSTVFCVLGYIFWRSFDKVADIAGKAIFGFGITVGVIVAVVVTYRRRREIRDWLLADERHPLIRPLFVVGRPVYRRLIAPLVRVVAPEVRFLWNRVTPGGLGLELTTTLAIAGVGMYVFALYVVILSGDPGLTPLDQELLDLATDLQSRMLTDVAKVVTDLGAFPTCATVVVVTEHPARRARGGSRAARARGRLRVGLRDRPRDEGGIDRPRPIDPLVEASGLVVPERARRLRDRVDRGRPRLLAPIGAGERGPGDGRDRAGGGDRPVADLPARALLVGRGRRLGPWDRRVRAVDRDRAGRRVHAPQWAARAGTRRARGAMNFDLSSTEIAIALAAGVVVACWLVPDRRPRLAVLRTRCGSASRPAS